jgi:TonB family protein
MSWLLSALVLFGGLQAGAATATGTIDGRVTDLDGGRMIGVTVVLSSPALVAPRTVVTDQRGDFQIAGLAAGTYDVALSRPSFKTLRGRISLGASQRRAVRFQMDVGSLAEWVSVRAAGPVPPAVSAADQPGLPEPGTPVRIGGNVREPKKLRHVEPVYPAAALAAGAEGDVIIEAVIARDGTVDRARVVQGVPLLDDAALDAVRRWLYSATMLNGRPIEVVMNVRISFARREP